MTLVNEWQQITCRHVQNVVSLRELYKCVNFNSTLVICLKFVFIEMLDRFITCILCWYKTYNCIRSCLLCELTASLRVPTTGSAWYKVLYQHTMYVMCIYISDKISSNTNPTKNRDELMCSGRVSSSCSTSGTQCVTLVENAVISHEWGNDGVPVFQGKVLISYHGIYWVN